MTDTPSHRDAGDGVAVYEAVADHLCDAMLAVERVDYNALPADELTALLEARETIANICLQYREQQHARERAQEGDQ